MSDDVVRPGPRALEPGLAPGGVVVHVYAVPTGRLVLVQPLESLADAERLAQRNANDAVAALHTFERGVCLVVYDGDTGARMRAAP